LQSVSRHDKPDIVTSHRWSLSGTTPFLHIKDTTFLTY
jgi:hypothetical protein